jgi:multiple sugar transport system ATP-binding protein
VAGLLLENVSKRFAGPRGREISAVSKLDLAIGDGEFLVIVGPSGCGKTTALRLIAGLETPDAGSIWLAGKPLAGVAPRDRDVAMVFQDHALLPHLTVFENIGFGLMLRRVAKEEIARRVRAAAEMLEVAALLDRKPTALSGGECQRVALGRALVRQPRVFLFDEPLSNLDAPMRLQLRAQIAALHRRVGAMMIYVTHDQGEAMGLADRVAVMKGGALEQVSTSLEVYRRPANRFVAGFIGSPSMNFFEGAMVQSNGTFVFHGGIDVAVDARRANSWPEGGNRRVTLGLRPEHIAEVENCGVPALVERVEASGLDNLVFCTCNGTSLVSRLAASRVVKSGDRLTLGFDMERAHFFDSETGKSLDAGSNRPA